MEALNPDWVTLFAVLAASVGTAPDQVAALAVVTLGAAARSDRIVFSPHKFKGTLPDQRRKAI